VEICLSPITDGVNALVVAVGVLLDHRGARNFDPIAASVAGSAPRRVERAEHYCA
jgi:hypothetical protein